MLQAKDIQVVIFILINQGKILVEKRPILGYEKDLLLVPGGTVKHEELTNLETALKRELMEELGIKPLIFTPLDENQNFLGVAGVTLKPFLITEWEGEIPKIGLDKDDPFPLEWVDIDIILESPIEGTRKIGEVLKRHLSKKK